jgi:hypothetical protein
MARPKKTEKPPKAIASTQSLSSFVKSICDVMRRSNCASALQRLGFDRPVLSVSKGSARTVSYIKGGCWCP